MVSETNSYDKKKCGVCESRMQYVYEPVTNDFVGYVCLKPDCENYYSKLVHE